MKRVFALFALVAILLTACVSGDDYTNLLTFVRRWNSAPEVKAHANWHIDEDTLWSREVDGKTQVEIWLDGDNYLLRLVCEPGTDLILASSVSTACSDDGQLPLEKQNDFQELQTLLVHAVNGISIADAQGLLKRAYLEDPEGAHYHEAAHFTYSLVTTPPGVAFRIENRRLMPSRIPELTLFPTSVHPTTTTPESPDAAAQ
ncbi:MAG: hypothetical protein LBN05_06500 [Oscillospiraceae bacterium]|jgi:hypothetical protein|nr:hypothetical protein [Oscillospiraceae bacterium]